MNRSGPPRNGSTPDWSRGSLNRQNEKSRRQNITASQLVIEPLCSHLESLRIHDRSRDYRGAIRSDPFLDSPIASAFLEPDPASGLRADGRKARCFGVINCDSLCELERSRAEELCRMFLPNGKKVGSEWKVGDISGVRGYSLGVKLTGPQASQVQKTNRFGRKRRRQL
jgi:hypothetical protein